MKDIFLTFSGPKISGDSLDKDHLGAIEIESWSQSLLQPRSATASTAGGHTSERTEHAPMAFSKLIDQASPVMYQHLSGGTTFDEVTVEFHRADGEGNRVKYLEIKMKHVIIDSIESDDGGGAFPTDIFTLRYGAIQWKYIRQLVGGKIAGNTQGAWSLVKNDKTYNV